MVRRFALLLAGLTLVIAPLQAGTIHEVFSQTYTGTTSLGTTDLLTPPTSDRSYLITICYTMTGTSSVGVKDTAKPYFTWTDDAGTEQLGTDNVRIHQLGVPI